MTDRPFLAGDVVDHGPTKERWTLACNEDHGRVMPMGWPETSADAADCTLVSRLRDDAERREILYRVAERRSDGGGSFRQALAASQLHEVDDSYAREVDSPKLDVYAGQLIQLIRKVEKISSRHGRDFVRDRQRGSLLDELIDWAAVRDLEGS